MKFKIILLLASLVNYGSTNVTCMCNDNPTDCAAESLCNWSSNNFCERKSTADGGTADSCNSNNNQANCDAVATCSWGRALSNG